MRIGGGNENVVGGNEICKRTKKRIGDIIVYAIFCIVCFHTFATMQLLTCLFASSQGCLSNLDKIKQSKSALNSSMHG